jgi:hypothetical protein
MYVCMHACINVRSISHSAINHPSSYVHVHTLHAHTYMHTYMHTYIHTHTCIHTYTESWILKQDSYSTWHSIHTRIHTYIHTYINTYIYRVFDPDTGTLYHMALNPPPLGVGARCVTRHGETPDEVYAYIHVRMCRDPR